MDKELKREIILDNYQHPFHKGLKKEGYIVENANNESCIDNLDISLKIEDGKIVDTTFDGEACAISTSATSILLRRLIGKEKKEAQILLENYENMIEERPYDESLLEELLAYQDIYLQPNRKNCALLPSKAIKNILKQMKDEEKDGIKGTE